MKRLSLFLAVLAAFFAMQRAGRADFIVGTQAYSSTATVSSPDGNDVNDTDFTLDFATLLGGSNQTGDYIGTVGSFINTLDTTAAASFVFGSAAYGTFAIDTVLENSLIPDTSRTLQFSGIFTPAAGTFGAGFDPTPGILTVTINEASVGGNAVLSASATLATSAIPLPSAIVLLATGSGPILIGLIRRRLRRST